MGNHSGWEWTFKSQGKNAKYGYLDNRPCYDSHEPDKEIHVLVEVPRDGQTVIVCGYNTKESLKHVLMYFDLNATETGPGYRPPPVEKRTLVTKRKHRADECTYLTEVPRGRHVLTLRTDPAHPHHAASLTHVITFS